MKSLHPKTPRLNITTHSRNESTAILKDIIEVWWFFAKKFGEPRNFVGRYYKGLLDSPSEKVTEQFRSKFRWLGITSPNRIGNSSHFPFGNATERFSSIFPQHPGSIQQGHASCMVAIMTYDISKRREAQVAYTDNVLIDGQPLIQAFAQLAQGCSVISSSAEVCFRAEGIPREVCFRAEGIPREVWKTILDRWPALGNDFGAEVSSIASLDASRQLYAGFSLKNSPHERALKEPSDQLLRAAAIEALLKQCQNLLSSRELSFELNDYLFSNFLASSFASGSSVVPWRYEIV